VDRDGESVVMVRMCVVMVRVSCDGDIVVVVVVYCVRHARRGAGSGGGRGAGTGRGGRWAKAGRVARNAAASRGLSHSEETLRDVGKAGQAKRCCTDWRGSPHSGQAELGERPVFAE
jgi:hypothetical protein